MLITDCVSRTSFLEVAELGFCQACEITTHALRKTEEWSPGLSASEFKTLWAQPVQSPRVLYLA